MMIKISQNKIQEHNQILKKDTEGDNNCKKKFKKIKNIKFKKKKNK